LQKLVPPYPLFEVEFRHTVELHVELHHCPSLHPTPHGINGIKLKQITK
jgi:hypothetical protein